MTRDSEGGSGRRGNGVVARKRLLFNGSGYDFDFQVEVTRDGQPVDVSVVVGPNFGDQGITDYGYYKPAPEVSYAVGTSVKRREDTHRMAEANRAFAHYRW